MLKRREECDTYLTHICRHHHSINYKIELSANTVAFINRRLRLTQVLAGAAREKKGSNGGEGQSYW